MTKASNICSFEIINTRFQYDVNYFLMATRTPQQVSYDK